MWGHGRQCVRIHIKGRQQDEAKIWTTYIQLKPRTQCCAADVVIFIICSSWFGCWSSQPEARCHLKLIKMSNKCWGRKVGLTITSRRRAKRLLWSIRGQGWKTQLTQSNHSIFRLFFWKPEAALSKILTVMKHQKELHLLVMCQLSLCFKHVWLIVLF